MNKKLNLQEFTQIGAPVAHHETCSDPVMCALDILKINAITEPFEVLDIVELEALINGAYIQSMQYL